MNVKNSRKNGKSPADFAILLNMMVLSLLAVGYGFLCKTGVLSADTGYLLGIAGANLPSFIKYCLYLRYEKHDEGECFE